MMGLTTPFSQPLWVILCRLPEKGRRETDEIVEEKRRRETEEIVEEMKERKMNQKGRNRRNYNIPSLPLPAARIAGLAQQ